MNCFKFCFAASLVLASFQVFAADDPIRESLEKAKVDYEKSIAEYQELANEYFEKKEDEARKQGKLKQVEQVKADRDIFERTGELPPQAPVTLRTRPTNALTLLSVPYTKAIEGYIRSKQDELAAATKKELAELKAQSGMPSIAGVWLEGDIENGIRVIISQTGSKFRASCKYQHKKDGEIQWVMNGTILKNGEIKGEIVHTKGPKGYGKQTRTGTFSASEGKITGHAEWQGGGHNFEWVLLD